MTCDIWVKSVENGFVATIPGLPHRSFEAHTREGAVEQARQELSNFFARGEIVRVEIDIPPSARARGVGIFADEDDESWNGFLTAMKEYRQQVDADPNEP